MEERLGITRNVMQSYDIRPSTQSCCVIKWQILISRGFDEVKGIKDLNLERASGRAINRHVTSRSITRDACAQPVNPLYTLLNQSLGHDTLGPRFCLSSFFLSLDGLYSQTPVVR